MCEYLPHISVSTHELGQEKISLQSVTNDTNKRECGNIAQNAGIITHIFPSGSCFHRKIKFYFLFFKLWRLDSLTRKNAYFKVMMISQQPRLIQNTLILQSASRRHGCILMYLQELLINREVTTKANLLRLMEI